MAIAGSPSTAKAGISINTAIVDALRIISPLATCSPALSLCDNIGISTHL